MDRRSGTDPGWLTASERLYTLALAADLGSMRDTSAVESLLGRAFAEGEERERGGDDLLRRERAMLRSSSERLFDRFDAQDPSGEERRFFNLLVNHLNISGYRAQARLNDRVEEFAADYPASGYTVAARAYFSKGYFESDFGAAFSAGYGGGAFVGDISDRFGKFNGPVLAGEVYAYRATLAVTLQICVASTPREFTVSSDRWPAGDARFIDLTFDGGYEFRFERLAVTPLVGISLQSLRGAGDAVAEQDLPTTQNRYGYDIGAMIGYRIPFDLGPHIDLRARLGLSHAALGDYSPDFSGSAYYVQLGFALVQRPYRGRASGVLGER